MTRPEKKSLIPPLKSGDIEHNRAIILFPFSTPGAIVFSRDSQPSLNLKNT